MRHRSRGPHVVIVSMSGQCPVQAEGTVSGVPFYFRARGAKWSLTIGRDVNAPDAWSYSEPYGTWPEAGWITPEQAGAFIRKAAGIWHADQRASTAA